VSLGSSPTKTRVQIAFGPTATVVQGWGNQAEAQFAATRLQEALEARYKGWLGRGTVRTLRAGTWATLTQSTLDPLAQFGQAEVDKDFFFTQVHALGINNLPKDLSDAIARTLGEAELPVELGAQAASESGTGTDAATDAALDTQALRERAALTGFACQFQALRRKVPWRPVLLDDTGARLRPRPTALGPQTAIVVGPQGQTQPQGADELYTDRLGRIKVKFHWQANPFAPQRANSDHSCWLRVMQRFATAGGGHQFIPRIGQEVLVGFLGNDIDRPVVIASLYNGRGESGISAHTGRRTSPPQYRSPGRVQRPPPQQSDEPHQQRQRRQQPRLARCRAGCRHRRQRRPGQRGSAQRRQEQGVWRQRPQPARA
jgi:type VI secretion system secreted protein VgrG